MKRKRQRNPRIFVDTPEALKRDYTSVCDRLGITISADLRAHMIDVVSLVDGAEAEAEQDTQDTA